MKCPPCKGTGKKWGRYSSDCELCRGEGLLPDTRVKLPECHHCNGSGLKEGWYDSLCSKCGGWGRRERIPVVDDPRHSGSEAKSVIEQLGLEPSKEQHDTQIVSIEAGKPRTGHLEVAKLLQELSDEVRICDPYYGKGSLLRLDELTKAKSVQFLTQKADSREQAVLPRAIQEFVKERSHFEFRKYEGNDMHDRFIVTEDSLILLGHGLKDIGNKDSFVVKFDRDLAGDVIDSVRASFDQKWQSSSSLLTR